MSQDRFNRTTEEQDEPVATDAPAPPPARPTVTAQSTNSSQPTIIGTAILDGDETLTVSVGGVTYEVTEATPATEEPIEWTALVNMTATGNDLEATSGSASAEAVQQLAGDGYIDFLVPLAAEGFSLVTLGHADDAVPRYAFRFSTTDGLVEILVNGAYIWDTTFTDNTTFSWDITDGVLTFLKNGVNMGVTPASVPAPEFPLKLTVTNAEAGVSLHDFMILDETTAIPGTLSHDGVDTWTLEMPVALDDGTYSVTATVTDGITAISDNTSNELTIDTTAPEVAITEIVNDTGSVLDDFITNDNLLHFRGTAEDGATVNITLTDGAAAEVFTTELTAINGLWSVDRTSQAALADGTYTLSVTATDELGNADTVTQEIVIDTVAPATPTVNALSTSSTTPTLTGTAVVESGESLTVTVHGVVYTVGDGNLTHNDVADTWELVIPSPLFDGVYDVTVQVTDLAGNVATDETSADLQIGTGAPVVNITSVSEDTGSSGTDFNTGDNQLIFRGNTTRGGTLALVLTDELDAEVVNVEVAVDEGDWEVDRTAEAALDDGTYTITASVTDLFANTGIATAELTVITTPPSVAITSMTSDSGTAGDFTTNDNQPVFNGTATDGATVVVELRDSGAVALFTVAATVTDGQWQVDRSNLPAIGDGVYTLEAIATDAVGNIASATQTVTIRTITPHVSITDVDSDTGIDGDFITSNNQPVFSGTKTVNAAVTISLVNDDTSVEAFSIEQPPGSGFWLVDRSAETALADGTYTITAYIEDFAGNADTITQTLIIDTTPPAIAITGILSDNGTAGDFITNDTLLSYVGTVEDGLTVSCTLTDAADAEVFSDDAVTVGTVWSMDRRAFAELADGTYTLTASCEDAAGNTASATQEIVIDTHIPVTPTVDALSSNSSQPTITGTAVLAADETLTVTVNDVTYEVGADLTHNSGDDTWSLVMPVSLADGTYDVTATVTTLAGSSASDETFNEVVIATVTPDISITSISTDTGASSTDFITSDNLLIYHGLTEPNLTVTLEVLDDTETQVFTTTGIATSAGAWSINRTAEAALTDGDYTINVSVTDSFSNTGTASQALTVRATPPVTPTVTEETFTTLQPTISGTATLQSGDVLTVTVNGNTYTNGDGDLSLAGTAWTLPMPVELDFATFTVTATVTDLAGGSATGTGDIVINHPEGAEEAIVWTNFVRSSATDNDLTATSDYASASSVQEITGNGYFEFTLPGTGENFATVTLEPSGRTPRYGWTIQTATVIEARVTGSYAADTTYQAGDKFKIEVVDSTVVFTRNRGGTITTVHTSAVAPIFPMTVIAANMSTGVNINDAVIKDSTIVAEPEPEPEPEPGAVTWENLTNATDAGSGTITSNSTSASGNTVEELTGDGYFEWVINDVTNALYVTLRPADNAPRYAFTFNNGTAAQVECRVDGTWFYSETFSAGDTFSLEVSGATVIFKRNGATLYTSNTAPDFPMYALATFFANGQQVVGMTYQDGAAPTAVAPVNSVPSSSTASRISVSTASSLSFTGSYLISVTDDDGDLATTRLTVTGGTLSVSLAGGATISAGTNNSSEMTLSGTQTQINAALSTLTYTNATAGNNTITVVSTDSGARTDTDYIYLSVAEPEPEPEPGVDGGFIEASYAAATNRGMLSKAAMDAFLPTGMGKFTFPSPYNTTAWRLSTPADGTLHYHGYSDWKKMNYHVGDTVMKIVVGYSSGNFLYHLNKTTEVLTKVGSLPGGNTEQWQFSALERDILFIPSGSRLRRYNVSTFAYEDDAFDVTDYLGAGSYSMQHVHIATDEEQVFTCLLGSGRIFTVNIQTGQHWLWTSTDFPDLDEPNIDRTGRWQIVLQVEFFDRWYNTADVIDLTGVVPQRKIWKGMTGGTQSAGTGGDVAHQAMGAGYMIAADQWVANGYQLWDLNTPDVATLSSTKILAFEANTWNASFPFHVSWENHRAGVALDNTFVVGSGFPNPTVTKWSAELLAFRPSGQGGVMVICPNMTDMSATGGGDTYGKQAKGCTDVTGRYHMWSANHRSDRLDMFIVKIPQLLLE